jgi:hypothetical protein
LEFPPEPQSDSETDTDNPDDEFDLSMARNFLESSFALSALLQNLKDFICPTFSSKLYDLVEEAKQDGISDANLKSIQYLVTELRKVDPANIKVVNSFSPSRLDRAKVFIEDWTGEEWNWWPLQRPRRPCSGLTSGISWTCVSTM